VQNETRFVTGLGASHASGNGFAFHPILGVPYLPGSGLKGLVRTWLRERDGAIDDGRLSESDATKHWFGNRDRIGEDVYLDMLPVGNLALAVDVMTPHFAPYYKGKERAPGDWQSPTPITFLTAEAGTQWQIGICPRVREQTPQDAVWQQKTEAIVEALAWLGAGAKTAVGYGEFVCLADKSRRVNAEIAEHEDARRTAIEQERALAGLPPDEAEIERRARSEGWSESKNPGDLTNAIWKYLETNPKPSPGAAARLRAYIESAFPQLWSHPDKTRGKKRKPEYTDRQRKLVYRIQALEQGREG
jgi:CRISPR-associated protein Cmr6